MSKERNLSYADERWFVLLTQAVADSNKTQVAKKIGYGRPTISQIMNGIYLGKPDRVAAAIMAVYDRWPCPYLNTEILGEECKSIHAGETPSHDPARLAHRRMCRTCKHNEGGKS